jgi:hypothetical protein
MCCEANKSTPRVHHLLAWNKVKLVPFKCKRVPSALHSGWGMYWTAWRNDYTDLLVTVQSTTAVLPLH